jgi:hypothetical protein
MGAWVPARLEINGSVLAKVPDRSFVTVGIPPGEVTLSATDMVNLRYADTDRMTLKDELAPGETAYFRITSVFGASCALVHEDGAGPAAYATHRFRHDSAQTSCFQRVPETVALKELKGLK